MAPDCHSTLSCFSTCKAEARTGFAKREVDNVLCPTFGSFPTTLPIFQLLFGLGDLFAPQSPL